MRTAEPLCAMPLGNGGRRESRDTVQRGNGIQPLRSDTLLGGEGGQRVVHDPIEHPEKRFQLRAVVESVQGEPRTPSEALVESSDDLIVGFRASTWQPLLAD